MRPETVIRWHRAGFKLYWTWLSRHRKQAGRRCVSRELRELIFHMVAENRTWGAPRIHGELKMLGFDISERTVLRWMWKAPRNPEPAKRWAAFLRNHREAIAAMDFFTVPTLTFGMLYCFFVIGHDRRRVLGFSITRHPSSEWVSQQLRETFPYDAIPKAGHAINLGGNGYPVRFTATAACLLPHITDPPGARTNWLIGAGDLITSQWEGTTKTDNAVAASCDPGEWLLIEAWDES